MKITWNDDQTEATISKTDLEALQTSAQNAKVQFDAGFAKGTERGVKDTLKHFDFLEIDETNIGDSVKGMRQIMTDLKNGKFPDELMKKVKDTDLVKDLQQKLETTNSQLQTAQTEFNNYKRNVLIADKIKSLATRPDATDAINPNQVARIFQDDYKIDLTDSDQIQIQHPNGSPVFNNDGKEMDLQKVFDGWAEGNAHLFKGNKQGGSGGGNGEFSGTIKYDKNMSLEERAALVEKSGGLEKFQQLVAGEK